MTKKRSLLEMSPEEVEELVAKCLSTPEARHRIAKMDRALKQTIERLRKLHHIDPELRHRPMTI